jgi:hypothetical protein
MPTFSRAGAGISDFQHPFGKPTWRLDIPKMVMGVHDSSSDETVH